MGSNPRQNPTQSGLDHKWKKPQLAGESTVEKLYNVLLTGKFSANTDKAAAILAFAKTTGISEERAEALFARAPVVIKRDVSQQVALSYQQKLQSIGVETELEVSRAAAAENTQTQVIPPQSAADTQSGGKRHIGFVFSGAGYEYFKIWIVNILLTIVTLGLYAPWAKVRNTQYFYGNTSLDNASFAFTANPKKMLIGRLIALGLLLVFMGINAVSPIAAGLLGIGLIFVFPWVLNRTLAFYARNTTYRNIRFRFVGTYMEALKKFLLWPIAGMLSLGLLMPYVLYKQQTYTAEHHRYGNKSFNFSASAEDYYKLCLMAFALVIVGAIFGGLLSLVLPQLGVAGIMLGYALGILYFMTAMNNLIFNNLTLSSHDFKANYELASFGWIMLSNFFLTLITLGLYIPWAKVRLASYAAERTAVDVSGDLDQFAAVSQPDESAFGEEFGDVFDMEVGF
jgi:uncharacterized membrane protein YjgN (DUF898 family)